ncbi:MAG: C-terminal processing peptidase-3 [Frankiales bacterium]|nr:C-terminal processing peptidase-3 [Frankiales bacterium]
MPLLRTTTRRVAGVVAALVALGGAFTAGVVAGAGSTPAPLAGAGVLDAAADQISSAGLTPVDRAVLDAAAIQGMLSAADDQWGTWADSGTGATSTGTAGVGLWLRRTPADVVAVAQVAPASPAALAGIAAGDEVRAVDGRSVRGMPVGSVAGLLRGQAGTRVSLQLARPGRRGGATLRGVRLVRTALTEPGVTTTVERTGGSPDVARVVVPAFRQGAGKQVRSALGRVRASRSRCVLLDLRGNGGGRLDEAVETASAFLDGGPVVSYSRRGGQVQRLDAVGSGDTRTPVVVLVDGGTASAAEVVAAALQDRGRAVLVGSRTFGKGSVQEPRDLPDGSALELTVARYTTPSGRSLEGVGLAPDIEVAAGSPPDVAVRRGVEVLTGLLANGTGGHG